MRSVGRRNVDKSSFLSWKFQRRINASSASVNISPSRQCLSPSTIIIVLLYIIYHDLSAPDGHICMLLCFALPKKIEVI